MFLVPLEKLVSIRGLRQSCEVLVIRFVVHTISLCSIQITVIVIEADKDTADQHHEHQKARHYCYCSQHVPVQIHPVKERMQTAVQYRVLRGAHRHRLIPAAIDGNVRVDALKVRQPVHSAALQLEREWVIYSEIHLKDIYPPPSAAHSTPGAVESRRSCCRPCRRCR